MADVKGVGQVIEKARQDAQGLTTGLGEMVVIRCARCPRQVRAIAARGVACESDIDRIGWFIDKQGRPVCDECWGNMPPNLEHEARVQDKITVESFLALCQRANAGDVLGWIVEGLQRCRTRAAGKA